jgi:hypothetical protein
MPQLRLTLLGLLAVLAVNYVSTESVIMAVHPSPPLWLILASINSIALALTMGLYVFLAMRGTAAAKAA